MRDGLKAVPYEESAMPGRPKGRPLRRKSLKAVPYEESLLRTNPPVSARARQLRGAMAAPHRALDRSRQAGVDPVAGEHQPFDGGLRGRPWRLARRKREGGARLADDGAAQELRGARRGQRVQQL